MTKNARTPKPTSDEQVAANQRNARKSTGPRTQAGKARSSRNAETHGAYARQLYPLESGPYRDDSAEFYERASKLIAGFEPEDELIAELAKRAADALMKMAKLDAYEADLSRVAGAIDEKVTTACGDLREAQIHERNVRLLTQVVIDDAVGPDYDSVSDRDWRKVVDILSTVEPPWRYPDGWLEDDPCTNEEWRALFIETLDEHQPDQGDRRRWANSALADAHDRCLRIEEKTSAFIARRILEEPLVTVERPRHHLWREFNQAVTQIRLIRKMRNPE